MSNEDRLRELARVLDSINSREGGSSSGMPERMGSVGSRVETHRSAGRAGVPGAAIGGGLGVQDLDSLAALMRVGVHTNVGVNFSSRWKVCEQACHVQQVYCSACSCSYSGMSNQLWQQFARLVLQANYEATLLAAASHVDGSGHVFLTFIGGGVFRNDMNWIVDAIASAVWNVSRMHVQLHVHVCHYREVTYHRHYHHHHHHYLFSRLLDSALISPRSFQALSAENVLTPTFAGEHRSVNSNQLRLGKAAARERSVKLGNSSTKPLS